MPEFKSEDGREFHIWYDSLEELKSTVDDQIERCNGPVWRSYVHRTNRRPDSFRTNHYGTRWFGVPTFDEAKSKTDNGWPELRDMLYPIIEKLKARVDLASVEAVTIATRRRKRQRQDYGDSLDMHRVWGGHLDTAWERPVRRNILTPTQRYATIFADLGMLASAGFTAGLWRAAAAYCMYEMLTRMGISTEIWTGDSGIGALAGFAPHLTWNGVRIKNYTETLNDERLAVMTSATFFRTYGFAVIHAMPYQVAYGLGVTGTGLVKPLRDRHQNGERVFRVGECLNEESAVQEVTRIINQLKEEYHRIGEVA